MFNLTAHTQNNEAIAILSFRGSLNRLTYRDLIDETNKLYECGYRKLVFDMRNVPTLDLAGSFALYSAAMLFNGDTPLDPVGGLKALLKMVDKVASKSTEHFKLLRPQLGVKQALYKSGLPIYDDLESVLTSF